MATGKTKFMVGLFVLVGMILAVAGIIWVGMSHLFTPGKPLVAYFNESVQGLDRDAPVKYRGVTIGRVSEVTVAPDGHLIEVRIVIESDIAIEPDMVAQLRSSGITGIVFVEIDRRKPGDRDESPAIDFTPKFPVIATRPSDLNKLLQGVDNFMARLRDMPIEELAQDLRTAVVGFRRFLDDTDIQSLSRKAQAALVRAEEVLEPKRWERLMSEAGGALNAVRDFSSESRGTVREMEKILAQNAPAVRESMARLEQALANTNAFLTASTGFVSGTDRRMVELYRSLALTIENLERALENFTNFTDRIADQPSQLLLGSPPKPRPVEPER